MSGFVIPLILHLKKRENKDWLTTDEQQEGEISIRKQDGTAKSSIP